MRMMLLVVLVVPALQGCVVWDIRNEMRNTNAKLVDVKATLDVANAGLDKANTRLDDVESGLKRLDRTNDLIGGVEQGMTRIDKTNTSLDTLQKQLDLLASIEKSLARLDAHLTAVRKTIGSINSMIPFLDLGGGEDPGPVPETATTTATGPGATPTPTPAPAGEGKPEEAATPAAKRDALVGIWVSRYPDDRRAVVMLPDGKLVWSVLPEGSAAGTAVTKPEVLTGHWAREGNSITFTFDAPKSPAEAGGKPGGAPKAEPVAPAPLKAAVVNSTTRAMALQFEDGRLMILGRP